MIVGRAICVGMLIGTASLSGVRSLCAQYVAPTHDESDPPHLAEKVDDDHSAADHGAAPNPLIIDIDLAVWTFLAFFVLYFIATKFAWAPIVESLERREQGIAGNIAGAEAHLEEAKHKLTAYEQQLAAAALEVREIVETARREAEGNKAEILAEAKAAAAAEHERAMRDVRTAKEEALRQIGDAAGGFAVELAGRVIERDVPKAKHEALVRARLTEFTTNV